MLPDIVQACIVIDKGQFPVRESQAEAQSNLPFMVGRIRTVRQNHSREVESAIQRQGWQMCDGSMVMHLSPEGGGVVCQSRSPGKE